MSTNQDREEFILGISECSKKGCPFHTKYSIEDGSSCRLNKLCGKFGKTIRLKDSDSSVYDVAYTESLEQHMFGGCPLLMSNIDIVVHRDDIRVEESAPTLTEPDWINN